MKRARAPTPFERAVYAVIRRIPRGQTRSYRWVAERLGNPGLARAVGNALHRNPDAPQVPCHRVVRADGTVGGYARGTSRKLALLRTEGWRPALAMQKGKFPIRRNAAGRGSCRGPAPRPQRRGMRELRQSSPPSPSRFRRGAPRPASPAEGFSTEQENRFPRPQRLA